MPANDSFAHKGRTVLSALNYKLNALCNVALYHDTPYGETHKNQLQGYYTTIYCDCQVRKVYIWIFRAATFFIILFMTITINNNIIVIEYFIKILPSCWFCNAEWCYLIACKYSISAV